MMEDKRPLADKKEKAAVTPAPKEQVQESDSDGSASAFRETEGAYSDRDREISDMQLDQMLADDQDD